MLSEGCSPRTRRLRYCRTEKIFQGSPPCTVLVLEDLIDLLVVQTADRASPPVSFFMALLKSSLSISKGAKEPSTGKGAGG